MFRPKNEYIPNPENKMVYDKNYEVFKLLYKSSGTRPVARDYNKGVRALCDKYGALLVFDEVVTGFRVALGGAQGFFDVVPDLTIFGKIVAGGYPAVGGVGGKKECAQLMAAGLATANPLSS